MIDLHCHILPGLDDGARDMADSIAMARQAEADGIEVVCATPHIRHDHAVAIGELESRVAAVNAELARAGVAVRVAAGGEVAETEVRSLSAPERQIVSLGSANRWMLVEPAPGPLSESLVAVIAELAREGMRAVVAHPERHLDDASAEWLAAAADHGALVQATAATVAEADGGPLVALAERGLVHVLGSDAHSALAGRPVALSAGLERLTAVERLRPYRDWIERVAPAAIVSGEDVSPPWAAG